MDWTVWIVASAVLLALYDLAKKAGVSGNAVLPVLLFSTCAGFASFALSLAAGGRLGAALCISGRGAALAALKCVIVGTSWIFTFSALRTLPVSIATPIRACAPALVFPLAFILYGERPSPVQGLGMASTFAGYFAMSWAGKREGIDFLRNRAVWCAAAGAVFSALSAIYDKFVFQVAALEVEPVQFVFQAGLVLFYGGALAVSAAYRKMRLRGRGAACRPGPRFSWRWTIPVTGILLIAADYLYFYAVSQPEIHISILSLVRRCSCVVTFAFGVWYFKDLNVKRKIYALILILLGVAILGLAK